MNGPEVMAQQYGAALASAERLRKQAEDYPDLLPIMLPLVDSLTAAMTFVQAISTDSAKGIEVPLALALRGKAALVLCSSLVENATTLSLTWTVTGGES